MRIIKQVSDAKKTALEQQKSHCMSTFKTEMKKMVQDLVQTKTKKEIQEASEELRVVLLLEVKEVLEKHLLTVR